MLKELTAAEQAIVFALNVMPDGQYCLKSDDASQTQILNQLVVRATGGLGIPSIQICSESGSELGNRPANVIAIPEYETTMDVQSSGQILSTVLMVKGAAAFRSKAEY